LFRAEESQEEAEAREALDLTYREASSHPELPPSIQDVQMEETRVPFAEIEGTEPSTLQAQASTNPILLPGRLSSSAIEQPDVHNRKWDSQPPVFASAPSYHLPPLESALEKKGAPINIFSESAAPLYPNPIITPADKEEDEEMPAINLDSDSDGD
jgi:hypothetical protein